jgi:methylated-DNA-[protein]-cysteine S-methyltransferase
MPDPTAPGPAPTVQAPTVQAPTVQAPTAQAHTPHDQTAPGHTVLADPELADPELAPTVLATVVDTPIGPLSLLAQGGRLIAGGFTADPAVMHARLSPPLRALRLESAGPGQLPWLVTPLTAYFDGDLRALDAIRVYQPGPPSRQRLWAALRAVPPGRTLSYTQLAAEAGNPRAPRAAGAACAYNLVAPVVPCHRALRSDGSLGGYYYGLDRKTWLLCHEGARPE